MLAIQILGVQGHKTTNALKHNTLIALKELGLMAKVEEVSDIDHFIEYDISSIPAMVINGQLRFENSVPPIEDLKLLLQILTKPSLKKKKMKNILIPIDFSETAEDAFRYAQAYLTKATNITVFHAYHPQIDPMYPYIGTPSEGFYKDRVTNLKKWAKKHYPVEEGTVLAKTAVDTQLKIAVPTDAIVEETKAYDLVIMGGTGETGFLEKTFGSTATFVARNAHCPVLLVPKGNQFKGYKKILYASNIESFDEAMLQQLVDFTWDYNPEISIVHINKEPKKEYEVVSEEYEQFFREKTPYLGVNFVKVESHNVVKGLHIYAEENEIDLIVMATKHRTWLEEVFHISTTKRMVLNTKIPLLVLHPEDVTNN